MDKKVVKFPVSNWQRHKNKMGPGFVPCMVSERWLQFPKLSAGHFGGGEFIEIEVMTNGTDDKPKKICNMIITREELTAALNAVKSPK